MERYQTRVFVTLTSLFLTQMLVVITRVNSLTHYLGQDFLECPLGSYQVEFSSNCSYWCPSYAPYRVLYFCMDFCPVGPAFASDCSHIDHHRTPIEPIHQSYRRCRKGFCPQKRPFCFNYQCLSECPHGTVNDAFSCVSRCSNISALVYNNSCVTKCPPEQKYHESNICVSKCSMYNVLYGNTCVRACPADMFRYNKTCRAFCPHEAPFILEAFDTKFCMEACPDFTSVDGHVCQVQCPHGIDFLWNKSCVETCPSSSPLVYVLKRRIPRVNIPICISHCPVGMFSDGISCVHICDKHMYVFNSTCVESCPTSHKLLEGRSGPYSCVERCKLQQKVNGNHCVDACPSDKSVSNRTCVSKCPQNSPLSYKQRCVPQCPMNLLNDSGICVDYCNHGNYVVNQTCVATCPRHYVVKHKKNVRYFSNRYCLKSCSDRIGPETFEYECRCTEKMFLYNHTCVDKCPPQYRLIYNWQCMTECPKSLVAFNNNCHESCPENATYVYDGLCMETCPSAYPHFATVERKSGNSEYETMFVPLNLCLDKCGYEIKPGKMYYDVDCVRNCPNVTVIRGPKCVHQCPFKLKVYRRDLLLHIFYIYTCVEACPDTAFSWEDYCYDQCPEHLVNYLPNRTCLQECPKHYRFRYRLKTYPKIFSCNATCNQNIVNGTDCVRVCPSNVQYLLGQTCVSECPASHMLDQEDRRCVTTCKPNQVELNRKCYKKCPTSHPIVMNNTCVKECPATFNLTSTSPQGTVCVRECKPPLFRDDNKCTSTCTRKLIVNNVCEHGVKCPDDYEFVDHSPQGRICRKACLENQFVLEGTECVSKCPKFAFGHHCVENCPASHPYTFNKKYTDKKDFTLCHSTCPSLTFETFCVDSCPNSYLAVKSKRTCVKQCPASHPIETDSKCLETCSLAESFSKSAENCVSMPNDLIAAISVSASISLLCFIGVYFICRTKTKTNVKNITTNASTMTVETIEDLSRYTADDLIRQNTDWSVRYECATSTIQIMTDSLRCERNSAKVNRISDSKSAFEGEMHINEETNLKETA